MYNVNSIINGVKEFIRIYNIYIDRMKIMFEIIITIIVLACMIYIFKGEFFRKKVVITVVESLPLTIFKKSTNRVNEEENTKKSEKENFSVKEIQYKTDEDNSERLSENLKKDEVENDISEEISGKNIEESFLEVACESLNDEEADECGSDEELVYWTPRGKTYHLKNSCRTLVRSKVINSGTIYESGKDFQCEHCK